MEEPTPARTGNISYKGDKHSVIKKDNCGKRRRNSGSVRRRSDTSKMRRESAVFIKERDDAGKITE